MSERPTAVRNRRRAQQPVLEAPFAPHHERPQIATPSPTDEAYAIATRNDRPAMPRSIASTTATAGGHRTPYDGLSARVRRPKPA
ncbi:hypothetical protein [Halostella sp. PRR32]|uniref:hypothetical protein n=1 Tax=Halostella sp. PRR32 TaxID=3098147 RepID=UPI002B1D3E8A|nr:hypothetical protein [Halostella sp. PRR32]